MRQWLIDFLKEMERLVPPPRGAHHAVRFGQYGSDETGWDDKLCLQLNDGGSLSMFFLDAEDFESTPERLAIAVFDLGRAQKDRSEGGTL